ncbi:MAG: S41 family peptidase [Aggregatilineales bacterium]
MRPDAAGIGIGAEITMMDGTAISDVLDDTFVWAHEALGTDHTERLQQLRYATRRPLGESVDVTFQNPGSPDAQTVTLDTISERQSFMFSSFNAGISGNELPVEFEILPSGYGYVSIFSFSDDEYLTVQLWERMIRTFKSAEVPGIIVDMRNNGGGSGYLADQLSAYFFNDDSIFAGNTGTYSEELDDFYFDDRGRDILYLPPEDLRYQGPVSVIITPACFSACEFFSYNLTLQERAEIVGHYPTGGLGGSVSDFYMPEGVTVRFTVGRAVDNDGNIHIEGKGVPPTIDVPVDEETLFAEDALLDAAELALTESIRGKIVNAGTLSFGETGLGTLSATGTIQPGESVEYAVTLRAGTVVSFYAGDETGNVDTILSIYDETGGTLLVDNDDASDETRNSALEALGVGTTDLKIIVAVSLGDGEESAADYFIQLEAVADTDEDGDGEPDRSNEG